MDSEQVPLECPACGTRLNLRGQVGWRHGCLAKTLFGFAGFAALLSPFYAMELLSWPDVPKETLVVACTVFSGMLLGLVAARLPRIRQVHCHRCEWSAKFRGSVRQPPLD